MGSLQIVHVRPLTRDGGAHGNRDDLESMR
jgi:hypothetical protein